ncbi:MAG: hypothetical protein M3Y30_03495 [Gemmatimonadota bacterium]|nr:hypothetical protein [Gemmatimonadota bacterium]
MARPHPRRSVGTALMLIVIVASVAFATPWASGLRQALRPQLPIFVVVISTLTGVWQLGSGLVAGLAGGRRRRDAGVSIALGLSALCAALSFLPGPHGTVPRLIPILFAAAFAGAAAVLQRRAQEHSEL